MNYKTSRPERDPDRVWLDETQCERFTRTEFDGVRCILGAVSYLAHAQDDLKGRAIERIPDGDQRIGEVLQKAREIADDLIGTMPVKQCKQIRNSMLDMDMRMVPKKTPLSGCVVMDKDIAKTLMDKARGMCRECTKTDLEARSCELYQIMEATTPLDDYGSGLMCAYAMTDWTD